MTLIGALSQRSPQDIVPVLKAFRYPSLTDAGKISAYAFGSHERITAFTVALQQIFPQEIPEFMRTVVTTCQIRTLAPLITDMRHNRLDQAAASLLETAVQYLSDDDILTLGADLGKNSRDKNQLREIAAAGRSAPSWIYLFIMPGDLRSSRPRGNTELMMITARRPQAEVSEIIHELRLRKFNHEARRLSKHALG